MKPLDEHPSGGVRDVITIDGPAGAGKTTTARGVAGALGFVYLDSGALYRGMATLARDAGLTGEDEAAVTAFLGGLDLEARPDRGAFRVLGNGIDLTPRLRLPEVSELASRLATLPAVRARVREILRELAARHHCVAEGRDMGSTVFPEATLKIYLDAPLGVRAKRRQAELAAGGLGAHAEVVEADMLRRDDRDRERAASPLRVPADAVRLNNAELSIAEQVAFVTGLYRGGGWNAGSWFHRMVKGFTRRLFPLLFPIKVIGLEHVPRGPYLLASNHRSYLDPPIVGSFSRGAVSFLAKAELFCVPGLGQLIRGLHAIPLRRGQFDKRALQAAEAVLRHGRPVAIFPEGTRVRDPELARPRRGVALLARRAQVRVVPVCLIGTDQTRKALLRRTSIQIRFGTPLAPPEPGDGDDAGFLQTVMTAIRSLERGDPVA
jgi:cytidylate kinase